MKHPLSTTVILLVLFLAVQLFGLFLIDKTIVVSTAEDGTITTAPPETPLGPPPDTTPGQTVLLILVGVAIGTVAILILARFRKPRIWKVWYLLAVGFTSMVSLGILLDMLPDALLFVIAFTLAALKVFRPNPVVHNLTELLIYPGIAIMFYHILSVPFVLLLLALISAYDVYAVWTSKHMVALAKFQTESKVFAGLAIPREWGPKTPVQKTPVQKTLVQKTLVQKRSGPSVTEHPARRDAGRRDAGRIANDTATDKKGPGTAILGGGDVAFPLLFSAVVLEQFVLGGMARSTALWHAALISVCAMASLAALFAIAKKDKFYPAMPAVTIGCLVGYGIALLI